MGAEMCWKYEAERGRRGGREVRRNGVTEGNWRKGKEGKRRKRRNRKRGQHGG